MCKCKCESPIIDHQFSCHSCNEFLCRECSIEDEVSKLYAFRSLLHRIETETETYLDKSTNMYMNFDTKNDHNRRMMIGFVRDIFYWQDCPYAILPKFEAALKSGEVIPCTDEHYVNHEFVIYCNSCLNKKEK
jgi:hypothetical protein